ncbi:MAG: ABC-type multidrug transport system, ATPase and permease component [Jatrophihabitans sp.]|nr:ABC-type multidrug transport system, ATPase and permease component [Jatrophihabitans sp.]
MALDNNETRDASGVTNLQVIAFIWSFWLRRKYTFAAACILMLIWTGLDLSLPIASSHLVATVASAPNGVQRAWHAWRTFIILFAGYIVIRNAAFRLWSVIAARNMKTMTNEVFRKLQTAPSEWHASHASGETIRRVVRAMWGYDAVTDAGYAVRL